MNCEGVRQDLPLHLRDELSVVDRGHLEAHLASCGSCTSELEAVRQIMASIQANGIEPPSSDLRAVVLAMAEADRLAPMLSRAVEPPRAELKQQVLGAIQREAKNAHRPATVSVLARHRKQVARALVAAAILVAGVVLGSVFGTEDPSVGTVAIGSVPLGHETQVVTLEGMGPSNAVVRHYRHDNFRLILSVVGYEVTPAGFHYAVWVRGSAGDVAIGTFRLKRSDTFDIPFAIGVNPTDYPELAVTLEPDDGDPALTGQIVTRGRFDPKSVHHGTYDE